MTSKTTPMNFRVPPDLKQDFEHTCRSLNLPMSAQLIFMIREFVDREALKSRQKSDDYDGPISFYITDI
ncbi:hypothetical protein [uncultured Shimia sp.]|uniref:hypothetical protein n=1 Tax=uncultured Shimia sp. TaxID=573152 RepID=UPI00262CBEA1|nr:hypothetical protein [uncultured Shimia sp.]